jgi:hypothetical protein
VASSGVRHMRLCFTQFFAVGDPIRLTGCRRVLLEGRARVCWHAQPLRMNPGKAPEDGLGDYVA